MAVGGTATFPTSKQISNHEVKDNGCVEVGVGGFHLLSLDQHWILKSFGNHLGINLVLIKGFLQIFKHFSKLFFWNVEVLQQKQLIALADPFAQLLGFCVFWSAIGCYLSKRKTGLVEWRHLIRFANTTVFLWFTWLRVHGASLWPNFVVFDVSHQDVELGIVGFGLAELVPRNSIVLLTHLLGPTTKRYIKY